MIPIHFQMTTMKMLTMINFLLPVATVLIATL